LFSIKVIYISRHILSSSQVHTFYLLACKSFTLLLALIFRNIYLFLCSDKLRNLYGTNKLRSSYRLPCNFWRHIYIFYLICDIGLIYFLKLFFKSAFEFSIALYFLLFLIFCIQAIVIIYTSNFFRYIIKFFSLFF